MTWEEKLQALSAIGPCKLIMREPGDWYVSQRTEIGGDGFLRGNYGNGTTPEEAIESHWREMTELKKGQYVFARDMDKRVRWKGFMWEDVPEDEWFRNKATVTHANRGIPA